MIGVYVVEKMHSPSSGFELSFQTILLIDCFYPGISLEWWPQNQYDETPIFSSFMRLRRA